MTTRTYTIIACEELIPGGVGAAGHYLSFPHAMEENVQDVLAKCFATVSRQVDWPEGTGEFVFHVSNQRMNRGSDIEQRRLEVKLIGRMAVKPE